MIAVDRDGKALQAGSRVRDVYLPGEPWGTVARVCEWDGVTCLEVRWADATTRHPLTGEPPRTDEVFREPSKKAKRKSRAAKPKPAAPTVKASELHPALKRLLGG